MQEGSNMGSLEMRRETHEPSKNSAWVRNSWMHCEK